ncbi:hypothetical protein ARSEF4850_009355 [Beauveria asiatica]
MVLVPSAKDQPPTSNKSDAKWSSQALVCFIARFATHRSNAMRKRSKRKKTAASQTA